MAASEPRAWSERRRQEASASFPVLADNPAADVVRVDNWAFNRGSSPTDFTRLTTALAAYGSEPVDDAPNVEPWTPEPYGDAYQSPQEIASQSVDLGGEQPGGRVQSALNAFGSGALELGGEYLQAISSGVRYPLNAFAVYPGREEGVGDLVFRSAEESGSGARVALDIADRALAPATLASGMYGGPAVEIGAAVGGPLAREGVRRAGGGETAQTVADVAGSIGGAFAPAVARRAPTWMAAADQALNPPNLRTLAPEAFERGRGTLDDVGNLRRAAIRPEDAIPKQTAIQPDVIRVYHGSNGVFTDFDLTRAGARDSGDLGTGIYVHSDPSIARAYADAATAARGGSPNVLSVDAAQGNVAMLDGAMRRRITAETGITFPPRSPNDPARSAALRDWFVSNGYAAAGQPGGEMVIFDPSRLTVADAAPFGPLTAQERAFLTAKQRVGSALTDVERQRLAAAPRTGTPRFPLSGMSGGSDEAIPGVGPAAQAVEEVTTPTLRSEAARLYTESAQKAGTPAYSGIVDALEQAGAAVRTDPQGVVSRLAGRIPGLRNVRNWDRPGLTMEKRLLEGHVARRGVENSILARQSPVRYDAIRAVDATFGDGASTGARVLDDLRVPGQHEITVGGKVVEYPGSGTVYDLLQRPYAYNVGDDVQRVAQQWAETDEGLRAILNDQYGGEVGKFVSERGGVYVPNVNVSEARQATLENLARRESSNITSTGKAKPRVWESGFDRWVNDLKRAETGVIKPDAVFTPETDLRVLGYTADLTKAHAAGNLTMRAATGGRTISEVKEVLSPGLVAQRDALRKEVASLSGRIQRAEQSMSRDRTVAARLQTQARQTAARADELAGDDVVEQLDAAIRELDRRAAALDKAASAPATRADLASQSIPMLREDLASLKDQYSDVKRAYDAINPQDFTQPQSMPGRYFPSAEAVRLDELARPAKDNVLTRTLEGWRSQVLAGDVGPLSGIQGIIAAASGRAGVTKAVTGALADGIKTGTMLRPFTQDAMEQFIRENSDLVAEYAFYTGRNVGGRLPAEIGQGGLLAKIPGFVDANEGMFNVVTRRQIEMFSRIKDDLVKAGYSPEEGAAAAADLSNKVLPLMTPARLGQGAAQAQEQRFLPTSLGFIRQPLALTEEAFSAMAKSATGKTITPREKLAMGIYGQFIGNLLAISLTSAGINAVARGKDPAEAIQKALDPDSRSFIALSVGDQTIPLANPFRSPLRAGIGTIRNILGPAIEAAGGGDIRQKGGASVVNYATGRVGPQIRGIGDAYAELTGPPWQRKYQGDNDLLRLLSAARIVAGGSLPIPAQGIGEEIMRQRKEGEFDPKRLLGVGTAEFGGLSLIPEDEPDAIPAAAPRPARPPRQPRPPRPQR